MLPDEYVAALKAIYDRLQMSNIEWCITGKTNLALQGIDVTPKKIGLLINHEDLEPFLALFSDCKRSEIEELDNGEAQEFTMFVCDCRILVCAEYAHGVYRTVSAVIDRILVDGMAIPCFSLRAEREAYIALGMEEKASLIKLK